MNKPNIITFTGLDTKTDIDAVNFISRKYPEAEWGVLLHSSTLRNVNRYPGEKWIEEVLLPNVDEHVKLSLHLCGNYVYKFYNGWNPYPRFKRIQLNALKYNMLDVYNVANEHYDRAIIIQNRTGKFLPLSLSNIVQLQDASGGKGVEATIFPKQENLTFVGYAGGIGPDNVIDVLNKIDANSYWIDMESKIRTNEWLDLLKCEQVLIKVYGG